MWLGPGQAVFWNAELSLRARYRSLCSGSTIGWQRVGPAGQLTEKKPQYSIIVP